MIWVALAIAFLAAAAIGVVFFRHWKEIRLLDPDTIKTEQERKVRERLVQERFDRRLKRAAAPLQRWATRTLSRATRTYRLAEERLLHASGIREAAANKSNASSAVQALLKQAAAFAEAGEFAQAERTYLEVLKQDRLQARAYRGLGSLFMRQRNYVQAKETFRFLERINKCDDGCYASLAEIAMQEGNRSEAETWYVRAADTAPRNAERHRDLAVFYLAQGDGDHAWVSARRAVALAPTDPAILELSVEAAILVRDQASAESAYEQLRPLCRDRRKLHALRDKIDGMGTT